MKKLSTLFICGCMLVLFGCKAGNTDSGTTTQTTDTSKPPSDGDLTQPPTKIDHPIVGLWSASQLPSSWAVSHYSTYYTATEMITEITEASGGYGGSIDIEIYRDDGTGFSLLLTSTSYFYTLFDYSINGDKIYLTNQLYTQNIKGNSGNFKDKSISDTWILFKIENTANDVRMIHFNPSSYSADSKYRNMTIDEYAAEHTTYIGWYYRKE